MNELETLTVKELQAKVVELGMSEENAKAFTTKAPLVATIRTMEANKTPVIESTEGAVPPVAVSNIEEPLNPAEERKVNKEWRSKAQRMKANLESQEKVSILVPLSEGEKAGVVENRIGKDGQTYQVHVSGAVESVQLNGFKYFIPKGRYVQVPMQIAEVVSKSQQQTLDVGKDISLDRTDPKTGRPMIESL